MAVEESTAPSGKPNIILIPWDTESPEHCERLFQQRIACGWKSDKIEKWKVYQREGKMSIHWAVVLPSDPRSTTWLSEHVAKYPNESVPLQDSALTIGGHPRGSSSSRSSEPFIPIGHISIDTVASTPRPSTLLADPSTHRFHLSAFYISRAIQRGGIGSVTVAAAERMAVEVLGARTLTLDTMDRKILTDRREKCKSFGIEIPSFSTQNWYERMGYRVIKKLDEHDETSSYFVKLTSGEGWCLPSVWLEKVIY